MSEVLDHDLVSKKILVIKNFFGVFFNQNFIDLSVRSTVIEKNLRRFGDQSVHQTVIRHCAHRFVINCSQKQKVPKNVQNLFE